MIKNSDGFPPPNHPVPGLRVHHELSALIRKYAPLPQMRARLAVYQNQARYFLVINSRIKLTRLQTRCNLWPMKVSRNQHSPFSPVRRPSFAGYYAHRGTFLQKCSHTHTNSILRYLTLTHYECGYILSEVESKPFLCFTRPFWGSLWS